MSILQEQSSDNDSLKRDLVYIKELNLVFCFISKNASSFLKAYIAQLARGSRFDWRKKNPHMPANTGFEPLLQMSEDRAEAILMSKEIPKVVVGREPLKRLKSAYLTRVITQQREPYDSHQRTDWLKLRQAILGRAANLHEATLEFAITQDISPRHLADFVLTTPDGALDRHLVPQTYFAAVDHIEYDLIGRVECLEDFLDDLCRLVGKPKLERDLPQLNKARLNDSFWSLSQIQTDQIRKRYERDYEFFGYANS
jgi:hypothetical protein